MAAMTIVVLSTWGAVGYGWVVFVDPTANIAILRMLFSGFCILAIAINDSLVTVNETTQTSGLQRELDAIGRQLENTKDDLARVNQYWEMAQYNNGQLIAKNKQVEGQLKNCIDETVRLRIELKEGGGN